ncbi:MAG TPA: trypsin-like peptidase domain-containing protein [Thermoleophilaceae bacterium]|nr:trypsin-like peptidase domain-containing protein [Thermoleophilaceae bacterium]
MSPTMSPVKQRTAASTLVAGALGGLIALVLGAVLIATDVIDTGDSRTVVREQAPISQPASDPSAGGGRTVQDIYRDEGPGVAFIQAEGVSESSVFGQEEDTATGSGFVVDKDGTILTNAHVVEGADEVTVSFEEGGDSIDAEVKGVDPDTDLAVLKIDPGAVEDLTVMPLGDSSEIEVGDPVVAIGNPFGLQRTVTTGIVSALQRQIDAPSGFSISNVIQTDASINPGNSGGPLLDAQGRVIGINSQIATGGGQGSVGIGFAVPVNTAKDLLPRLREGEDIERAYLGVSMATVNEDLANDADLPADSGALVESVEDGTPAEDAGLRGSEIDELSGDVSRAGDLIVAIDGEPVDSADDVVAAVAGMQPGDTAELEIYRGDDKRTVRVKLGERPAELGGSSEQQQPQEEEPLFPLP